MWVGEGSRWAGDIAGQWCSIVVRGHKYTYPGSTKPAYGYHSPEALIAMAMLTRGGLPRLAGRNH